MSISAKSVRFDQDTLWVDLADGRSIGAPLTWFPRLQIATPEARAAVRISASGRGLHWDGLNEDISVEGLLQGRGDQTRVVEVASE
jgi:hypothetical protein